MIVKVTVDTNVLVRSVVRDDSIQAAIADRVLRSASVIAIPIPVLCEFVWVLRKVYGFGAMDISTAVRVLLTANSVVTDLPAAEAGLAMLEAGGDFADGAIALQGQRLGGDAFVSFDKQAVLLLKDAHWASPVLLG